MEFPTHTFLSFEWQPVSQKSVPLLACRRAVTLRDSRFICCSPRIPSCLAQHRHITALYSCPKINLVEIEAVSILKQKPVYLNRSSNKGEIMVNNQRQRASKLASRSRASQSLKGKGSTLAVAVELRRGILDAAEVRVEFAQPPNFPLHTQLSSVVPTPSHHSRLKNKMSRLAYKLHNEAGG
jgi:hypothetical protein